MRNSDSIKRAKRMRSEPTSAEAKLWAILRGRRYGGRKFRRQQAIGPYVVDFACVAARLVIEVDGPSHGDHEQAAFDAQRTVFLERAGCAWRACRMIGFSRAGMRFICFWIRCFKIRRSAILLPREGEKVSAQRTDEGAGFRIKRRA